MRDERTDDRKLLFSMGIQYRKRGGLQVVFEKLKIIKNQSKVNGKEWCGIIGEIGELSYDG